jgi:hypothetical protein
MYYQRFKTIYAGGLMEGKAWSLHDPTDNEILASPLVVLENYKQRSAFAFHLSIE